MQIAYALKITHENKKTLHRDLKPENILVLNGKFKITDFGIAKNVQAKIIGREKLSKGMGTANYMAPELHRKDDLYTFAVDIFALGCILDEACNLRETYIFRKGDTEEIVKNHILSG